jgi:hypothetical protein
LFRIAGDVLLVIRLRVAFAILEHLLIIRRLITFLSLHPIDARYYAFDGNSTPPSLPLLDSEQRRETGRLLVPEVLIYR